MTHRIHIQNQKYIYIYISEYTYTYTEFTAHMPHMTLKLRVGLAGRASVSSPLR